MKKLTLTLLSFILTFSMFAGGLVTNTNQSAAWARMLVRDASTDIDAAYYNPAGLTKLSDGFHLSLSNQTVKQVRTINNSLLNKDFEGNTFAPIFPNLYAVYKTGKVAFSFGFMGIGGGGSAEFDDGVPMIELGIASMPAQMEALGATGGYAYNSSLTGTSIYFGFQAGVSYEINDMISIYAGGRYVMANNAYEGTITDVALQTAGDPLTNASVTAMAVPVRGGSDNLLAAFDAGQLEPEYPINEGTDPTGAVTGGLLALGYSPAEIAQMNMGTAQVIFDGTATSMETAAGALADQKLDAKQSGSGFTPIIGVNLAFMEDKLNIGIKYEFKTNLELTNDTESDIATDAEGNTMFPDGEKVNADMPAMLSIGVGYQLTDALYATFGFHTYFDKNVGWENVDDIDKGYLEYGLGLEYAITEQLLVSAGWLGTQTGVKDTYHTDLSYSLNSNTFALGGAYRINDMLKLQLGGYYTMYQDLTIDYVGYSQTYKKTNMAFAVGLDFTFGGK